ncbi:MAG: hypothetical protein UW22_C0048G0013 [Candidatus Gottesmanbacteria bacterium GW2011_GWB1_44_11c]|uniref:Uncharacterized protein n=1 Tax=Candidatus Gottesmanbacteria bacterium GW2011_GWB1_44_11c TaxID=1618447 RepID=A0A0G1GLF5_9BACT|nr:MAG: hypothetical protein UW22_C0048G0013 [Candidatus Gottesmanbacteria bacterium GW2011_GWB1_44_11c]
MMSQYISEQKIEELEMKANEARELLIEMLRVGTHGRAAGDGRYFYGHVFSCFKT